MLTPPILLNEVIEVGNLYRAEDRKRPQHAYRLLTQVNVKQFIAAQSDPDIHYQRTGYGTATKYWGSLALAAYIAGAMSPRFMHDFLRRPPSTEPAPEPAPAPTDSIDPELGF